MVTAAAVVAAECKQLQGPLLRTYLDLCQDTDVVIRKAALNNLKLLFPRVDPAEVEPLFFAEVSSSQHADLGTFHRPQPRDPGSRLR